MTSSARGSDANAVGEVIQRSVDGWQQLSAETVLSTVAQRPDIVIWGTDRKERWDGFDAFERAVREQVAAFSNPSYKWENGDPKIWTNGDVAWACGDLHVSIEAGDEVWSGTMRSSFVLERHTGDWKIVHAHYSLGQEDPAVEY